jgi:hypothetical protein
MPVNSAGPGADSDRSGDVLMRLTPAMSGPWYAWRRATASSPERRTAAPTSAGAPSAASSVSHGTPIVTSAPCSRK